MAPRPRALMAAWALARRSRRRRWKSTPASKSFPIMPPRARAYGRVYFIAMSPFAQCPKDAEEAQAANRRRLPELEHQHAAVHVETGPGDVGCLVGGQEKDPLRDLRGVGPT